MLLSWFGSQVNVPLLIPHRPSLAKNKNVATWLTCFVFLFISGCSRLRQVNILVNFGHDIVFSPECFSNLSYYPSSGVRILCFSNFPRCLQLKFFWLKVRICLWVEHRWRRRGCKINAECEAVKQWRSTPRTLEEWSGKHLLQQTFSDNKRTRTSGTIREQIRY